MSATVESKTETAGAFAQILKVRQHSFRADMSEAAGGADSGPGPHDLFDAALASCKALTAIWYARKHAIPLERADAVVERDDSQERQGKYVLTVRMDFIGPLSDEQRTRLRNAVAACPVHKLMTTVDVVIQ